MSAIPPMDEFIMMVGYCITAWAGVEAHLFGIFARCLKAPIDRAAIVYYRASGLNVRLELTDELVMAILPKKLKKSGAHDQPDPDVTEWNGLRCDILKLLPIRRRIAHHPVQAKLDPVQAKLDFEIYMSEAETLRSRGTDAITLKMKDLVQHYSKLQSVTTRAAKFSRETLPKYFEQYAQPNPELASLARRAKASSRATRPRRP